MSARASSCLTSGVRVDVQPQYMAEESQPVQKQFAFAYRVRLTNHRADTVQLLRRHWEIVDAHGRRHDVDGDGVVGQQPTIAPGESFEYSSWCPLTTPWGTMEGHFTMRSDKEELFDVRIERFYLVAGG